VVCLDLPQRLGWRLRQACLPQASLRSFYFRLLGMRSRLLVRVRRSSHRRGQVRLCSAPYHHHLCSQGQLCRRARPAWAGSSLYPSSLLPSRHPARSRNLKAEKAGVREREWWLLPSHISSYCQAWHLPPMIHKQQSLSLSHSHPLFLFLFHLHYHLAPSLRAHQDRGSSRDRDRN